MSANIYAEMRHRLAALEARVEQLEGMQQPLPAIGVRLGTDWPGPGQRVDFPAGAVIGAPGLVQPSPVRHMVYSHTQGKLVDPEAD